MKLAVYDLNKEPIYMT